VSSDWPQRFTGDKFLVNTRYKDDEKNTPQTDVFLMKVGGRGASNEKIESGRQGYPLEGSAHHGQAQIDGGERFRQFSTSAQTPPPYPNANWN
jgi:hypothetical protein